MAFEKLHIYTRHSRNWRANRYVYPVISRRSRGLSVGVNLNPDKVCNFDCIYCCVDRKVPPAVRTIDMAVLEQELDHMLHLSQTGEIFAHPPLDQTPLPLRPLRDVAFSGDGEPTSAQEFPDACKLAARLLDSRGLRDAKIVTITNATLLHRPAVMQAMAFLDQHNGEIWAKLDAGTEQYYRLVERTSIPLQRVLDNILAAGRIRPIVIQSLFMLLQGQGPDAAEIDAYVGRLRDLVAGGCQIRLVQVYTIARETAEAYVAPLPDYQLDAIASKVRAAGLAVEAFYGPQ